MELFWPKKLSHWRTKIPPGILSKSASNTLNIESQIVSLRIFESNWLDIESHIDLILRVKLTIRLSLSSQFDSNILQLLGILGRILVPPVTQLFRSKWLHFFFQWTLSLSLSLINKAFAMLPPTSLITAYEERFRR